jgi:hypothetical protein
VNERGDDEFIIRAIRECPRRCLQRVFQPGHTIARKRLVELRERGEHAVR